MSEMRMKIEEKRGGSKEQEKNINEMEGKERRGEGKTTWENERW